MSSLKIEFHPDENNPDNRTLISFITDDVEYVMICVTQLDIDKGITQEGVDVGWYVKMIKLKKGGRTPRINGESLPAKEVLNELMRLPNSMKPPADQAAIFAMSLCIELGPIKELPDKMIAALKKQHPEITINATVYHEKGLEKELVNGHIIVSRHKKTNRITILETVLGEYTDTLYYVEDYPNYEKTKRYTGWLYKLPDDEDNDLITVEYMLKQINAADFDDVPKRLRQLKPFFELCALLGNADELESAMVAHINEFSIHCEANKLIVH